jgi:hypothetical protein
MQKPFLRKGLVWRSWIDYAAQAMDPIMELDISCMEVCSHE